jgi:hypothetical protein
VRGSSAAGDARALAADNRLMNLKDDKMLFVQKLVMRYKNLSKKISDGKNRQASKWRAASLEWRKGWLEVVRPSLKESVSGLANRFPLRQFKALLRNREDRRHQTNRLSRPTFLYSSGSIRHRSSILEQVLSDHDCHRQRD